MYNLYYASLFHLGSIFTCIGVFFLMVFKCFGIELFEVCPDYLVRQMSKRLSGYSTINGDGIPGGYLYGWPYLGYIIKHPNHSYTLYILTTRRFYNYLRGDDIHREKSLTLWEQLLSHFSIYRDKVHPHKRTRGCIAKHDVTMGDKIKVFQEHGGITTRRPWYG